jgi:hypothetical protein
MSRVKFLIALLPAFLLLALPGRALADSHTYGVVKDTFVNEAYPDNNYGTTGGVVISNKFTTRLGYLWFDDINLPEGATLVQAILKFYVHEINYSDRAKINIGFCTNEWNENVITWTNKPLINQSSAIEAEIPLTEFGWREINITSLVQKWVDGSQQNKGLFIYPLGYLYGAAETEYAFTFKTKESGDLKAKIDVEYSLAPTPTPSPTATPTLKPTATPKPTATITPEEEEPTPTPGEVSPTPTPTPKGKVLGSGQLIGGGLILLGLIGLITGLVLYLREKKKKDGKKTSPATCDAKAKEVKKASEGKEAETPKEE